MKSNQGTFNFVTCFSAFTVITLFVHESDGGGGKNRDKPSILTLDVWMAASLTQCEESSKVTIATTESGYSLACVPTEEGRQQCAELAKVVGKDSLHYVELLTAGELLYSYCTSDLSLLPDHVEHVCNYKDPPRSLVHVFDIRVAMEGTQSEMCRTIAIANSDLGPLVLKTFLCDSKSKNQDVMKKCENEKPKKTPAQKSSENGWNKKENLEKLCEVVEKEKSQTGSKN